MEDQFYGERSGRLRDPFGQQWMMSQHIEDVPAGRWPAGQRPSPLSGSPRDQARHALRAVNRMPGVTHRGRLLQAR